MEQKIEIIADDRERSRLIIDFLASMDNVTVNIKRRSLGDYLVNGKLIFERKTLKDFASSIIDGRLFTQAIRLAESEIRGIVILEGRGQDLSQINVSRESIQGALISVSVILGIPVLRSLNPYETARLMIYSAKQVDYLIKGAVQRKGRRPIGKRKRQLFILQGLPGVGAERAERLLDAFGSVEAVIHASSRKLQSVEGIGRKIAGQIKWAVKEHMQPYPTEAPALIDTDL